MPKKSNVTKVTSCYTTCYGSGNSRTCTTHCY
jgi:hypothetical protein